ncbi:unnamed protein product [Paramecium pentaurelia]|uniref:VWFA domain-containing protein n=1 Tax=Paramecium pentaurelia TaxID=43138 RepID=A0A8S1URJ1_9CILI|nr:unnamed protein product [Paramecium pentaurelia]
MSSIIKLSEQRQSQQLNYLIKDKQSNYFSNEKSFAIILSKFLYELNEEDKQIAIIKLNQIFPELTLQLKMSDLQVNPNINTNQQKSKKSLIQQDFSIQDQQNLRMLWDLKYQEDLENARNNKDWVKLKQLIQYNQFFSDGKYPQSFLKLVPLVEKLKKKSFILIDLADSVVDSQFQLNLSTFKNLLFYFFLPHDLNLTQEETQEIEQLIGEIINQSWLQFEYHQYQLMQNDNNQSQLEHLQIIPKFLFETPQRQREIIEWELKNTLKQNETTFLFVDLEYFITQQMPIQFELQKQFYQICFYFLSVFHQEYKKNKRLYENEKNKLLNIYIEEKTKQNSQTQDFSDGQFYDNQLEKYFANYQVQQTLNKYSGKGINFKSNEQLLQYFIDTNFYYFNKQIHIVDISQQNKPYAKILNLLTEINDENKRKIATFIKTKIQVPQSIIEVTDGLSDLKYQYDEEQLEIIFRIICEMMNIDFNQFWIYRIALKRNFKIKYFPYLDKFSKIQEETNILEMITLIQLFDKDFWDIVKQDLQKQYYMIVNSLIGYIQYQQELKDVIMILRNIINQNCKFENSDTITYLFYHLLEHLEDEEIIQLFMDNRLQNISLQAYLISVGILFKLFYSLSNNNDKQKIKTNLEQKFPIFNSYNLKFLIELVNKHISKDILNKIYILVYYWIQKNNNQLKQEAQSFYKNDPKLYQIFSKLNYFECEQLSYDYFLNLEKQPQLTIYPRGLHLNLEEFNKILNVANPQDQLQLIQKQADDFINSEKSFKDVLLLGLNWIKREGSVSGFLEMINKQINDLEIYNSSEVFNQKSFLQLIYDNCNNDSQYLIQKKISEKQPIPLLYKIPYEEKTGDLEKYKFNQNTYFIHQKSFTIINLSIQQDQRRVGKTQLINKIFYQEDKFEILDNNKLNDNSIDIMYDYQFQGTRNLSIADAHKFIPLQILDQILPLFKLWIIQLDTEKEIESTIQVLQQLKSFQLEDKTVCFLIRDSSFQLEQAQILKLKELNIEYIQVANLTDVNLNKYIIENEIQQVGKFLYVLIERNKNNNLVDADEYQNLVSQINIQDQEQSQQIGQASEILFQFEYELDKLNQQLDQSRVIDSFYSLIQHPNFYILYHKVVDILQKFNQDNFQKIYFSIWQLLKQVKNTYEYLSDDINQKIEELIFLGEPYEFQDTESFRVQLDFLDDILTKAKQKSQGKTLFLSIVGQSGSGNSKILNKIFGCKVQRRTYADKFSFQLLQIQNKNLLEDYKYVILLDSLVLHDQNQDHSRINNKIGLFIQSISDIIIINAEGDIKTEFKKFIEKNLYYMAQLGNYPKKLIWWYNNYKTFQQNLFQSIKDNLQLEFSYKYNYKKAQYYDQILDIDNKNRNMFDTIIIQNEERLKSNDDFFYMDSKDRVKDVYDCISNSENNLIQINLEHLWSQIQNMNDIFEFKKLKHIIQHDYVKDQISEKLNEMKFPEQNELIQQIDDGLIQDKQKIVDQMQQQINQQYEKINQTINSIETIQFQKPISPKVLQKSKENVIEMIENVEKQYKETLQIIDNILEKDDHDQEEKELQQDEIMREKTTEILMNNVFPDKSVFLKNIQEYIEQNIEEITSDILQRIKEEQIQQANFQFEQAMNYYFDQLSTFSHENKIKSQIEKKYQAKIQDLKKSEQSACNLAIYLEIQKYQENIYKSQFNNVIQQNIKELLQDPNKLKELREKPANIEVLFRQIINIQKQIKKEQDDAQFNDYCHMLLENIQSQFKDYSLQINGFYKQVFLYNIIENQPNEQDFNYQYQILQPELLKTQFKVLKKTDKKQFQENFNLNIENKLEMCFNKPLLQLKKFYERKINIKQIHKSIIEFYMNSGGMLKDFKREIINNDKQQIQQFLVKFTIFDYEIDNEKVDQLCQAIQNDITDQEKQEFLFECFKPIQKQGNQIILNEDSISKMSQHYQQLTQCLKQFEVIEVNDYSEIDHEKQKDYYLIESKPTIYVQEQFKYLHQIDIFIYIMNQQKDLETKFNSQIIDIIQELMNDNQQDSWKIMYEQIHSIVYDDMLVNNTVTASQNNFGGLIIRLIQKLEIQIKEFNKQFSLFGVLLSEIGEKCIFNYAIFKIWRILCFKYWEQKKKNDEKEFKNLEQHLFIKFKADLLQNKQEQSQIRGKQQATEILKILYQKLYQSYAKEVKGEIAYYDKETSYDLIKRLDTEILQKQNNSITNNEMLEYIRNHAAYIKIYVRQNLVQIKSEIQQKFTKKLKGEMKFYLEQILKNTKKLNDFQQNLVANDYFVQQINPDEAPNLLYKIVMDCIQGALDKNLVNLIKPNMIQGFQIQGCHKFTFILKNSLQNKLDEEIQILYDFMQSFNQKIQDEMKGLDQLDIDFDKLDIQSYLDALQVKQIGCEESCPFCKRKCDLQFDSNHKHQCRNGHQLRGMSGVLVGCNPSLFTCEEIQDYCTVQIMETKSIKYWGDIKDIYNDWLFSYIDVTEKRVFLKQKFTNIWNLNVGQVICKSLTQEIGKEIQFITQEIFDKEQTQRAPKPIHYVIMFDDSGSMSGSSFDNGKQGVIDFLSVLQKYRNKDSRVTIIMFNSEARVVVDFEVINPKKQESKIIYEGGGTDFDEPFNIAYEKIIQRPNFDNFHRHSMFFYTDGGAGYPQTALNRFESLSPKQKQKIELNACCLDECPPQSLEQIVAFFKKDFADAQIQPSIQPEEIGSTWIEIISQKTHQISKLG